MEVQARKFLFIFWLFSLTIGRAIPGWSEQHPSWINSSILLAFISMFFQGKFTGAEGQTKAITLFPVQKIRLLSATLYPFIKRNSGGCEKEVQKDAYSKLKKLYVLCQFDLPIKMNLPMIHPPLPWQVSKAKYTDRTKKNRSDRRLLNSTNREGDGEILIGYVQVTSTRTLIFNSKI